MVLALPLFVGCSLVSVPNPDTRQPIRTHMLSWGVWGVPAVAKTCRTSPQSEADHVLPHRSWPCIVGPSAEPSCIGSQECVDNDLCLLIAWWFGTAVMSFPLALVFLVVAKWPAFLLWDYKLKLWLVLPLVLILALGWPEISISGQAVRSHGSSHL